MAELSDVQLVDFCNVNLRPLADQLQQIALNAPLIEAVYNARNLGTVITAGGAGELITDGSSTDGRTRVTGGDVFNFITLLQGLQTFLTQGRKDVIAKWQVHGGA